MLFRSGTNNLGCSYTQPNAAALTPVYFKTQSNSAAGAVERVGELFLSRATQGRAKAYVGQEAETEPIIDTPFASDIIPYVGAFWRAGQMGERVIKFGKMVSVNDIGDWTATVVWKDAQWGSDNIVLAAGISTDPQIYKTSPGNAESYLVTGTATTVTGTVGIGDSIMFRIGLTNTWSGYDANTAPARYAIILLSYNNNTKFHKLYLRQGEGADYLVNPSDRPMERSANVKKFSPYNLTAPGMSDAVKYVDVDANDCVFVDYPTQGGSFFRMNIEKVCQAWHPTRMDIVEADVKTGNLNGFDWIAMESCPSGYRRPTTDNLTVESTASEFLLSLLSNPSITHNPASLAYGYYADGLFDRKTLEPQNGSLLPTYSILSVVDKDSHKAAYAGQLFFNNISGSAREGASIFLPAAGMRNGNTGVLFPQGGISCAYWSSVQSISNVHCLLSLPLGGALIIDFLYQSEAAITQNCLPIRCVKE